MSDLTAYFKKVAPAAKLIEQKTGVPAPVISAMMSWETGGGTNQTTKYGNELGIKYVGQKQATGGKVAGMYAGYKTPNDFADDVARILGMNAYGYPAIVKTAKNDPSAWGDIIRAWNASSWAEDGYDVTEIVSRAYQAREVQSGIVAPIGTVVASGGALGTSALFNQLGVPDPATMSSDDLLKYASIGIVIVGIMALAK